MAVRYDLLLKVHGISCSIQERFTNRIFPRRKTSKRAICEGQGGFCHFRHCLRNLSVVPDPALNMFLNRRLMKKRLLRREVAIQESKAAAERTEEAIIQKNLGTATADRRTAGSLTEEQKDYAIQQQQIAEGKKRSFPSTTVGYNAKVQLSGQEMKPKPRERKP